MVGGGKQALDGHTARALNAATKLGTIRTYAVSLEGASYAGAELDSLCDLANFGIAPALIVFLWSHRALPMQPTVTVTKFDGGL